MKDLIERQTEIDALEAQERQRAAQKRRYTFGNNEFSLEAAYHDCKLVFDGITDDDTFQEADTGLILYYANEIIYALHEALEGEDTNVLSNDCISRQAAIDAIEHLQMPIMRSQDYGEQFKFTGMAEAREAIIGLPSARPTLCGYNIDHLVLIVKLLEKENLPPERVSEALSDIGRVVAIVEKEFEEMLRKAVEQCKI